MLAESKELKGMMPIEMFDIQAIDKDQYYKLKDNEYFPVVCDDNSMNVVGASKNGYYIYWLSQKFTVNKLLKDEDTNEKYIEISVKTQFGLETITIPMKVLNKRDFSALQGKFSFKENSIETLIKHLIRCADKVPCVTLYKSVGWFELNDELYFRSNKILCDDMNIVNKYMYDGNIDFEEHNTYENFDAYLDNLNSLLTTEGTMFSVVVGLSSALISLLKLHITLENIFIHIFGDSSSGKSTFLKLSVSMWAKPDSPPLVNEWNSTVNAIYATLSGNMGITCGFDEASCTNSDFSTLIYNISHGHDKAKCNKDSSLRKEKTWSTTIISTAEESLLSKSKKNNGIRARCMEFFNLNITHDSNHAESIGDFINQNYGMLGVKFVDYLYKIGADTILNDYMIYKQDFSDKLSDKKCNISDRIIKTYAVILQTAIYADRIGVNINEKTIVDVLVNQHTDVVENTKTADDLYYAINDYIVSHRNRFPEDTNYHSDSPRDGITGKTSVLIIESVFNNIVLSNGFSDVTLAKKWLYNAGYLKKQGTKYYKMRTINRVPFKCYEIVSCFVKKEPIEPMTKEKLEKARVNKKGGN